MTEPIIVGADGSRHADRAVEWAADEAARRNRSLHIVHTVARRPYDIPLYPPRDEREAEARAGQQVIDAAEKLAGARQPGVHVTSEVVAAGTVPVLCDRSARAFETVVGHRGLGGFASLLLGSVGLRMAERAAGPVVIVRGETGRSEVAVGIGDAGDSAALEYAFEAASLRGARLRVVRAYQIPDRLQRSGEPISLRELEESVRWQVIEAHAPWRRRFPDVDVVEEIIRDHPVAALAEVSRQVGLLVVGSHAGLHAPRLGSVSHGIVHHSHCPVAVARAPRSTDR
ncbi:universal stress protein [Actinomadura rudentiformis]|uniref:Universal stress protein n=1 Tax=Actinomadura rudentiformis TaxID=359158 RepID=A0A6H9YVK5_9ACTN|nr:universal stress protein [Actinomadura rudentiformis]KAB2352591.1 universal stress protein [Actinomadura rudentiformis]